MYNNKHVRVADLESFVPHCCAFESRRQGLLVLSCEEAIKIAYGKSVLGSTQVRDRSCLKVYTEGHLWL